MNASNNDMPTALSRADGRLATRLRLAVDASILLVVAVVIYAIGGWSLTLGGVTIAASTVVSLRGCTTCTDAVLGLVPPDVRVVGHDVTLVAPSDFRDYAIRTVEFGLPALVIVFALFTLRGVVTSLHSGAPFTAKNTRRLRTIGLQLTLCWPITYIASVLLTDDRVTPERFGKLAGMTNLSINMVALLLPIFLGMVMLTVAAVFRIGMRLREDVEGLV